jgi:hypothetical protein
VKLSTLVIAGLTLFAAPISFADNGQQAQGTPHCTLPSGKVGTATSAAQCASQKGTWGIGSTSAPAGSSAPAANKDKEKDKSKDKSKQSSSHGDDHGDDHKKH